MLLKWNNTNVLAFPFKTPSVTGDKKFMQSPQDVKWLQPGWNEFPKAVWEQNKAHPMLQKYVKKGTIELFSYPATIRVKGKNGKTKLKKVILGGDDRPLKLRWLDEKMAIIMVKSMFVRDILQRWTDEETRHKVKKALRKQIEPLLNTSEDEDDDGGDSDDDEDFE